MPSAVKAWSPNHWTAREFPVRMNLEDIMVRERSQTQNATEISFNLYKLFRIGKSIDTKSRLMVARGWGRGTGGMENYC